MSSPEAPCRLFVYLASDAPLAAVLRRGPSDWARLSLWHTGTDAFEHGQWMRGRVYERRSDLSADGSLFAAFVRQSGGREIAAGMTDTWIALSRPPWFTALALWKIGGTYAAGACFPDGRSLFLGFPDLAPDQGALPAWLRATSQSPYVDGTPDWTERTVHINRLLRDGWRAQPDPRDPRALWERAQPGGAMTLSMEPRSDADFAAYGGPHVVDYALRTAGELIPLGRLTWADWDQRGRLIIARDGRLLHWRDHDAIDELCDFNPQRPDPQPSPAWAREWPPPPA